MKRTYFWMLVDGKLGLDVVAAGRWGWMFYYKDYVKSYLDYYLYLLCGL